MMDRDEGRSNFPWAKSWPEIVDRRVRAAFAKVTRLEFVDESLRKWADRDAPLPIGEGQTISQPFVVALMTQALGIEPGDTVLEIGTGSGFQTAILCELASQPGHTAGGTIFSVERFASLGNRAAATLDRLGYRPHLMIGDGALGWPEYAPYDHVIVTAAPVCVPRPLWEQVCEGGNMIVPVGPKAQDQILWLLRKDRDAIVAESIGPVRFVPLVSALLRDPKNCVPIDEYARGKRPWSGNS